VANYEKKVPLEWINESRTDMLPEFLAYARPLIQAELTPIYINGLTQHIVEERV
jgi:6-phosphofructokinase 1